MFSTSLKKIAVPAVGIFFAVWLGHFITCISCDWPNVLLSFLFLGFPMRATLRAKQFPDRLELCSSPTHALFSTLRMSGAGLFRGVSVEPWHFSLLALLVDFNSYSPSRTYFLLMTLYYRTELAYLSEKSTAILDKYYHSINHEKRDKATGTGRVSVKILVYIFGY